MAVWTLRCPFTPSAFPEDPTPIERVAWMSSAVTPPPTVIEFVPVHVEPAAKALAPLAWNKPLATRSVVAVMVPEAVMLPVMTRLPV